MKPTTTQTQKNSTLSLKLPLRIFITCLFFLGYLLPGSIAQVSNVSPTPISNDIKPVEITSVYLAYDTCILMEWAVKFKVEEGGSGATGGFIIQKINLKVNKEKCDGSSNLSSDVTYWEAWEVGSNTDTTFEEFPNYTGDNHDDLYGIYNLQQTKGKAEWKGEIAFISNPPGGSVLDSTWTIDPNGPAGALRYTTNQPPWWNRMVNSGKLSDHDLKFEWNCCNTCDSVDIDTNYTIYDWTTSTNMDPTNEERNTVDTEMTNNNTEAGETIHFKKKNNNSSFNDSGINLEIFPNPVNRVLNIKMETIYKSVRTEFIGIDGRIVFSRNFQDQQMIELNMENFEPGLYMLRIHTSDQKSKTLKVIKH
jgi:hypothetical protein